jgi:hypothetical protein
VLKSETPTQVALVDQSAARKAERRIALGVADRRARCCMGYAIPSNL